jgi:small subunit ribosomal protein S8
MSKDTISDCLTSIRNALMVRKRAVTVPHSKLSEAIIQTLEKEGFVHGYSVIPSEKVGSTIEIKLKYVGGISVISGIKSVSTPGRRVYVGSAEIKPVLRGLGISIVSTNKGVMSNVDAKCFSENGNSVRLGGEILCNVW